MVRRSASTSKKPCFAALSLLILFLSGCGWRDFHRQLLVEWNALMIVMTGRESPLSRRRAEPAPSESAEPEFSANAARAKANAELLREIYRVVFGTEPRNRAEFGSLVDSLNQGASFEGMYNGFVHSGDYRKLEITYDSTSQTAVRVFSEELALIEADLSKPTDFGASAARPLAQIDPSDPRGSVGNELVFQGKQALLPDGRPDPSARARQYQAVFSHASIFTLKRVLGDEAIRLVGEKKARREELAQWYSKWVMRMATKNVDFGLPLRNKADEKFHLDWAMKAPVDNLEWEILNRIHRVLNHAHEQKP